MSLKKNYQILAIDTSCDDTSVAVTADDRILSNVISSQVKYHEQYGGVVPFIAKRMHLELINPTINETLLRAKTNLANIDAIAVTVGPGLAPALEVGIATAKELAIKCQKPLIAVNHMEGHLLSSFAKNSQGKNSFKSALPQFPLLALLISGGHTELILMKNFGQYKKIGETLDDAAGEAFDKLAKMLNLGYPGGPIISELAKQGTPNIELPIPMVKSADLNFSYSGLKTACLYKIREMGNKINRAYIVNFAASFENTVAHSLTIKLEKAIKSYKPKQIVLGGGVISNATIRKEIRKTAKKYQVSVLIPYDKKLFTDNAAMIGVSAWYQAKRNDFVKDINSVDRLPNLSF